MPRLASRSTTARSSSFFLRTFPWSVVPYTVTSMTSPFWVWSLSPILPDGNGLTFDPKGLPFAKSAAGYPVGLRCTQNRKGKAMRIKSALFGLSTMASLSCSPEYANWLER